MYALFRIEFMQKVKWQKGQVQLLALQVLWHQTLSSPDSAFAGKAGELSSNWAAHQENRNSHYSALIV